MRRIIGAVFTFAAIVSVSGQFSFHSGFSPGQLPLIDEGAGVNGTWSGDIYQNGAGFQEVGGLSLATGTGIALSQTFGPIDATGGHGSFGLFQTTIEDPNPYYDPSRPVGTFNQPFLPPRTVTTAVHARLSIRYASGENPPNGFSIRLYDSLGGSSKWDVPPSNTSTVPGLFVTGYGNESVFVGDLDWTSINRFGISGLGESDSFHTAFDSFALNTVPEPPGTVALAGLCLIGFCLFRYNRNRD